MAKYLFYFILLPALLPVVFILIYIFKQDKIEREPLSMVLKVFFMGALFSLIDIPLESIADKIINSFYAPQSFENVFALNFFGVALIEELTKWFVLYLFVWKSKNFDYRFDGIVYATTSSLGFAGLENILYVILYGTSVAISRAIFSIPGHAAFGIVMGYFLSRAKHCSLKNNSFGSTFFMILCLVCPIAIHGTYDFLLSPVAKTQSFSGYFFLLVIALDFISLLIIRHESRTDKKL